MDNVTSSSIRSVLKEAYAGHWKQGQTAMSPTKGRVVDHIAFSVDNLAETIERLTKEAVKITDPIRTLKAASSSMRSSKGLITSVSSW